MLDGQILICHLYGEVIGSLESLMGGHVVKGVVLNPKTVGH